MKRSLRWGYLKGTGTQTWIYLRPDVEIARKQEKLTKAQSKYCYRYLILLINTVVVVVTNIYCIIKFYGEVLKVCIIFMMRMKRNITAVSKFD